MLDESQESSSLSTMCSRIQTLLLILYFLIMLQRKNTSLQFRLLMDHFQGIRVIVTIYPKILLQKLRDRGPKAKIFVLGSETIFLASSKHTSKFLAHHPFIKWTTPENFVLNNFSNRKSFRTIYIPTTKVLSSPLSGERQILEKNIWIGSLNTSIPQW